MAEKPSVATEIGAVAESVEKRFLKGRRVLAFSEYLDLFASAPVRFARDASRYLRDCFDHYGTTVVEQPWGKFTRWNLFDLPWDALQAPHALIGQEQVQEEIYRSISNFVREGRPNRLVLLHGPNGSAKSTIVACMMRALENYSLQDEGALYRFNWVFPSSKTAAADPAVAAATDPYFADAPIGQIFNDSATKLVVPIIGPKDGVIKTAITNGLVGVEQQGQDPAKAWDKAMSDIDAAVNG